MANDDVLYGVQDQQLLVGGASGLLVNDADGDGDSLTVVSADSESAQGGTVVVGLDGDVAYLPGAGFWGADSFGYTISDGVAEASAAAVVHVAPVLIQLSSVSSGLGGFALDGEAVADVSGYFVSGAGDVNGDGLADIIVGSQAGPISISGRSYVVFGKADTTTIELSDVLLGDGGFAIDGEAVSDNAFVVAGAGDVNGDGLDDVIVGAIGADPNGSGSGRSYVVFGKADTAAVDLGSIVIGVGGFALNGEAAADNSGRAVNGAGDVNGDGLDDVIVGAPGADPNGSGSGRSYVVFGKADTAMVELSAAALGDGGFVLDGEADSDGSGGSVSGAGDVNGDGLADVAIGASGADPNGLGSGRSYVVFGKANTTSVDLGEVGMFNGGFLLNGEVAGDGAGVSISGAGDVDGDGLADIIVGAMDASPNGPSSGRSYVVFGKADAATVELGDIVGGAGGFVLHGEAADDESGGSVGGAGDVNGDGLADLIVGARYANANGSNSGRSYLVFGKVDTASVELGDVALGSGGFALDGESADNRSGFSVSGVGDVDDDGLADVIIGAPYASPTGNGSGRSYVVFGVQTEPG